MKNKALITAGAIVAMAGSTAGAQNINWLSPIDGDWNGEFNWDSSNVPNAIGENAIFEALGTYTVDIFGSFTIGGISIINPGTTLTVGSSRTLTLNDNFLNDGLMVVNPTGSVFNAHLDFNADAIISGTGSIMLNAVNEPNDARILASVR